MSEEKKKTYKIGGADFRFKGVTYREGSIVEMTDAEWKAEKGKIGLSVVKKGGA